MASGRQRAPGELTAGHGTVAAMNETQALISGAGPTGLPLACDLARRGADFRIIERTRPAGPRGKGLQPCTPPLTTGETPELSDVRLREVGWTSLYRMNIRTVASAASFEHR